MFGDCVNVVQDRKRVDSNGTVELLGTAAR